MNLERLEQAKKGDKAAFAELFEHLRPTVFAIALRVAGASDAEDVTMQAFLRIWQALPQFEGRSSPQSWAYRIAMNCALDNVRRKKRNAEQSLTIQVDENGSELSAHEMESHELRIRVQKAMRKLPDEHRIVLELRYTEDMDYATIAHATGVSIGTVMSRLFNAKRKLKRILTENKP
jgi:RNA polymerase sigma-70 factor (ECF subfamily)